LYDKIKKAEKGETCSTNAEIKICIQNLTGELVKVRTVERPKDRWQENMLLGCILQNQSMKMWLGFKWLWIDFNGCFL
jgi:hypothetical protein